MRMRSSPPRCFISGAAASVRSRRTWRLRAYPCAADRPLTGRVAWMDEQAALTFDDDGLVTAVAQDAATGDVLMVAHMNREALQRTLASRQAWYWSRRRARLWRKGEQSGHTQQVEAVSADCDGDAVLLCVRQVGPACHTGHRSCFYRAVVQGRDGPAVDPEPGAAAGPSAAAVPVGPAREAGAEVLLE